MNKKKPPKKTSKKTPNSIYLFTSQFCLSLFFKDPSFVSLIRCLIREKALLTSRLQSSPFREHMTSSPGTLQPRNSASSTPRINLCREMLYPPPLGRAQALPTSSSVAGTESVWKFRFSCPPAACPAGWSCLWAAALLRASPGTGMQSWSRAGFHSQLPLCAGVLLDARSLGRREQLWGELPKVTLCQKVTQIPP